MYFTRRGFLIGSALAIAAPMARPSDPSCALTPEAEVGPYYIDDEHLRRDITEGKPGVPLTLRIALVHAKSCSPLGNAALDIWHCDASGLYSGFTANSPDGFGGPPPGPPPGGPPPDGARGFRGGPPPSRVTDSQRFLRGVQVTNEQGIVEFTTVYPGWYAGRAIHIHMKVHTGEHVSHTGQLFFPEDVTADIAKLEPYAKRLSVHRTTQQEDHVYQDQHGSECLVKLERLKKGSNADGFVAAATLAVDPEATPAPVGFGGPRGRRG
jgi:protocatechuate 3,4-dioxygenase beta subunit